MKNSFLKIFSVFTFCFGLFGAFTCFAIEKQSQNLSNGDIIKSNDNKSLNPPKVSIIVPVYNVEKYLPECLDSLINQTLKNIEIICINDGSPDRSPEILEEYAKKDKRIKVIHKENGGVSSAKNAGIDIAKGEYITFVDSDDWIDLDGLEEMYINAKKYDADIVCGGWRNLPKGGCGRKDCCPKFKIYHDWFKAKRTRESIIACNKLYRRTLLIDNNLRFNVDMKYAEDEALNLCIYPLTKTVISIPKVYYNYRVRESSATFSGIKNKFVNYEKLWKYAINAWKSYGVSKSTYLKLFTYPLTYKGEYIAFLKSCM